MKNLTHLKRLFAFMTGYKIQYATGMFLYSIQGYIFPLLMGFFSAGIMAAILAGSFEQLINTSVITFAMYVLAGLGVGGGIYLLVLTNAKIQREMRRQLFDKYTNRDLETSQATHSGDSLAALNTDVGMVGQLMENTMYAFLQNFMAFAFSVITIFIIDWRLGLAGLGVGAVLFFAQNGFTGPLARLNESRLGKIADSVRHMTNFMAAALPIRAYNMQNKALRDFETPIGTIKILDIRIAFIQMWQNIFTTVGGWLSLITTFVLGGWLVINGHLEFPVLMMMPPLMESISMSMGGIGRTIAAFQGPLVATKRVFEIIDAPERHFHKDKSAEFDGYNLAVKSLDFSYQNAENTALSGVSLEISENKMVAFVGESGSGKSTLLRAIIGMYERPEMPIFIGGLGFNDSSAAAWRSQFAYVDQSCKLFNISIAENVEYGKLGISQVEVEIAAKRAVAHDFIMELEDGYGTDCGEKGGSLSGGQKQRIAIARALAKRAPILVFDEATAALDKDSERYVMETIESLRTDHTILITTHNLDNIVAADSIVVMDGGKVAEVGTHGELMALDGIYRRLFDEQER
ncbi:MAG: ABC transporter ATP-binding protein/permease [Turicibacter sp.]|nr:ABC transporter ATP-binding protein/permease [Turicibacter sp.]